MSLINRQTDAPGMYRAARHQHRDFLGELSDAVRENPVPAALVGMGILWMFTGGGKTTLGDAITSRAPASMASSLASRAASAGEAVSHGAASIGSSIADAAHGSMDAVAEAASRVGHALAPSTDHEPGRGYSSPAYGGDDRGRGEGLQQGLSDFFARRPLFLGAAGLALGAGIAASLPSSKAERQAFGKASDTLRNAVSDVAGQAKDMASEAIDEARRPSRSSGTSGN